MGLLTLMLTAGCGPQRTVDTLCVSMKPIYLTEGEIAALERRTREDLAGNNRTWEEKCGAAGK